MAPVCLPTDGRVLTKIKELVDVGVRRLPEMQRHVRHYVSSLLFAADSVPAMTDSRYWPSNKSVLNCIYRHLRAQQAGQNDDDNVVKLVEQLQSRYVQDKFAVNVGNTDSRDTSVVFAHQSKWQQDMMHLYGRHMCLIDATYRTNIYEMPLFFLCVLTNCGYVNVATFLLSDEQKDSVAAGLNQIAEWNAEWHPQCFVSDFSEAQIAALENVFPDAAVNLCKFHRLQAWRRHLQNHPQKDDILKQLNNLADARTADELPERLSEITDTEIRDWLDRKWLPHVHRWVQAFICTNIFSALVATTNGLERQHQKLKYSFLHDTSNGSLADLVTVIVESYVPSCRRRYCELNVRCLDTVRSYDADVPDFLRNRPDFFRNHCLKRIPPCVDEIPDANIAEIETGVYIVRRSESSAGYIVRLSSVADPAIPSCECEDWRRHCLPCKHLLSVIIRHEGSRGWEHLPQFYRKLPIFNLDYNVIQQHDQADTTSAITAHDTVSVQQELDSTDTASECPPSSNERHVPTVTTPSGNEVDGNISESSNATVVYDPCDSVRNPGNDPVQSTGMSNNHANHGNVPSYGEVQRQIRQVLGQLTSCTYTVDNVQFLQLSLDDIAGLQRAKTLINEATVLPIRKPMWFKRMSPVSGILLFGPPGTGKTELAKAVATESRTTFFNVTTSSLLGKWHGESEKAVAMLFTLARHYAPSTVFVDEIDGLCSSRETGDTGVMLRIKNMILQETAGINTDPSKIVLFLGATNYPWKLDDAILRRLQKRIYVNLPDVAARTRLLDVLLKDEDLEDDVDIAAIAEELHGYSGSDMKCICMEAAAGPRRRKLGGCTNEDLDALSDDLPPITREDFSQAIRTTRPTVSVDVICKHQDWNVKFGSS